MINIDEARFEQLIQAETKLDILYSYITKSEYCPKRDILKMMGWEPETPEPPEPPETDGGINTLGGTE